MSGFIICVPSSYAPLPKGRCRKEGWRGSGKSRQRAIATQTGHTCLSTCIGKRGEVVFAWARLSLHRRVGHGGESPATLDVLRHIRCRSLFRPPRPFPFSWCCRGTACRPLIVGQSVVEGRASPTPTICRGTACRPLAVPLAHEPAESLKNETLRYTAPGITRTRAKRTTPPQRRETPAWKERRFSVRLPCP